MLNPLLHIGGCICYIDIKENIMLEEKVKAALENVRPKLQADGGDVEFVSVDEEGIVSLRLTGRCGGCPHSQMTLKMIIERMLVEKVPGVKSVIGVD